MTGTRRIRPTHSGSGASRGLAAAVGKVRLSRLTLVAVAAACAALAVPPLASAEDFCVGEPGGCSGTPVAPSGLAAALTAAQSNHSDDRFFLAPGLYDNGPLSYNSPEKLELIGAGIEGTLLRSSSPGPAFTLGGNPASTISNLKVVASGNGTRGLALDGTRAEGAAVEVVAGNSIDVALTLSGGASFSRGSVKLTQNAIGVGIADTGTLSDSSISAPNGSAIFAAGSDMTVRRSTLTAKFGAVVGGGHLAMSDTLIDVRDVFGGAGVRANTSFAGAGPTLADLERLTIVGSSDIGGVLAEANGAGKSASVRLRDSVISGIGKPLTRLGTNGGVANISTDRSNYPDNTRIFDGGPGSLVEERRLNVDPRFVDPGGGDFHLAADSPLIDAGTPGALPADATSDRDGQPRASDGDGDCTHVPDIGAFELQGSKVTALATAGAASAQAGQPVSFSSAGSCIPGPGEPQAAWSFDDGAGATGAAVEHAFATPGQHTATLTIGDGAGHQASASATVEVTAAPARGPAAPVLSKLRVSPGRVAIGKLLPKLVAKPAKRPAATISFTLSKAAKVELRFAKIGTSGKLRRLKPKLRVAAKRGVNRVRFAGRLSRKVRLAPGAYRLTAVATDAAGARSAPTSKRFTAIKTR